MGRDGEPNKENDQPGLQVEAEIAEELEKIWRTDMLSERRGFYIHCEKETDNPPKKATCVDCFLASSANIRDVRRV